MSATGFRHGARLASGVRCSGEFVVVPGGVRCSGCGQCAESLWQGGRQVFPYRVWGVPPPGLSLRPRDHRFLQVVGESPRPLTLAEVGEEFKRAGWSSSLGGLHESSRRLFRKRLVQRRVRRVNGYPYEYFI